MSYFTESESQMGEQMKVVLDLANYATKKQLNDAPDVDTSNLAAKGDFVALETKIYKLKINKLVDSSTSLQNLKTKVDDLDVGNLKTPSVDLNDLNDLINKQVVENTKFNILQMEVNNLEKEIPFLTTLIYVN